jgi:hypothetical protein
VSSLRPSDSVIRRLRAHGLVPAGELVTLATAGPRLPSGALVSWLAVHPVTGASYMVASRFPVAEVAASRQWMLRRGEEPGVVMVVPEDQRSARMAGSPGRRRRR